MNETAKIFLKALHRHWRGRQFGTLFCSGLKLARVLLLLLTIYALLDLFLAFSSEVRWALNGLGLAVLGFLLLWELISVFGISRAETASCVDDSLANRRQPVLSACELLPSSGQGSGELHQFFIEKILSQATEALRKASRLAAFPKALFKRESKRLLIVAACSAILFSINLSATRLVLTRIIHPAQDIPPYSSYKFEVTPAEPKVLYGGNVELRVKISGAPINQPVWLLTRNGTRTDRTSCFREGESVFSLRLEKVVDPLDFSFSVGKARSTWRKVELLLQPKISLVKLTVTPPRYTQLPSKELILGQESFEGYKGSRARLQLTSNRPLSKGVLTVTPLNSLQAPRLLAGDRTGMFTVTFDWDMQEPARLEARVEDIQGTSSTEPLQWVQQIIADRSPEASFRSPPAYSQATAKATLMLEGIASDDLALRNVDLVRAVAGYRDRVVSLGPEMPGKSFPFQRKLDLRSLGVEPGQVLEFYLEARDNNPERTGIASSELVRIEIISEAEYAETIRATETLDQFVARYEVVQEKMEAFQKTLDALEQELAKTEPDNTKVGALLNQLREQNKAAQELFSKLAEEFQAYANEAKWSELLADISQRLEGHGKMLQGMQPGNPKLGEVMQRLRQDFQKDLQDVASQVAQAEEIAKVARVMEHASLYLQLLSRQRQLVRQLQRYEAGTGSDSRELVRHAGTEAEIRKDVEGFIETLDKVARELPENPEYDDLRKSASEFAKDLKEAGAIQDMQDAVTAGNNQEGPKAYRSARLALEKMENLLDKGNQNNSSFAGLCRNRVRFTVREELQETMGQMLAGILSRGGRGEIGEAGAGGGQGDARNGFSVPTRTRLNRPMYGPARSALVPGGGANGGMGQGNGPGIPGNAETARGRLAPPDAKSGRDVTRSPELAPEKYRDALKRYFNQPEKKP